MAVVIPSSLSLVVSTLGCGPSLNIFQTPIPRKGGDKIMATLAPAFTNSDSSALPGSIPSAIMRRGSKLSPG
ncbi:hypothetical protein BGX38DRAFT_1234213 [Terfezia claveryi]|nr:hypothetical protein BGX38DRAFT_1234213 [Terfezia claveryi]